MKEEDLNKWLRRTLVIVFVLWLVVPITIMCITKVPDNAGEIGDVFGSVNALFTAVAFALLVYTSLLQREDLRIQKQELELTRQELKKSAEAQRELVRLTKNQLINQKKNRRNEILPIISIDYKRTNWDINGDKFVLTIQVIKKARFYKIKFMPKGLFNVLSPIESDLNSAVFTEGIFSIVLKKEEPNDTELSNENLLIYFEDLDGNRYSQLIQLNTERKFKIGKPKHLLNIDDLKDRSIGIQ